MKRAILLVIAVGLTVVVLAGSASAQIGPGQKIFTASGEVFTMEDLNLFYIKTLSGDGPVEFFKQVVVYEEAKRLGLAASDQEIQDFIKSSMTQKLYDAYREIAGDAALKRLIAYSIVSDKYDKYIRDKVMKEQNINVSEAEAQKYYLDNLRKIQKPERVEMAIISTADRAKADQALSRLKGGETFEKVAGEINDNDDLRTNSGYLGEVARGEGLPKALEDVAFSLKAGTFSDIVRGENFNILYVLKKLEKYEPTFDQIKDQLMSDILESKLKAPLSKAYNDLWAREIPKISTAIKLFQSVSDEINKASNGKDANK